MDRSVPAGAALLLDFIASKEAPQGYGTVYGNKQAQLAKPLTAMTFDEVVAGGPDRTRRFGSSACGRYQFMRDTLDKPGTLADLKGEMGLSGRELFSPDLQDRLGYHLLKRRGYEAFAAGTLSIASFGLRIAQEWASFPVLADTKGAKRQVVRGQSYYAGDGLNKALVSAGDVEACLAQVRLVIQAGGAAHEDAHDALVAPAMTVAEIQRVLIARGLDLGTGGPSGKGDDGDAGPKTAAAIAAFQRSAGLAATGKADAPTCAALALAVAPAPAATASALPWLALAHAELGVKEAQGAANNPVVVRYYADAGHPEVNHDETAWCAAFVGAMLRRAGIAPSGSLLARSYLNWGRSLAAPVFGCVGVMKRGASPTLGHVGFVVGASASQVILINGNSSDQVCFAAFPRSEFLGFRWPAGVSVPADLPALAGTLAVAQAAVKAFVGRPVAKIDNERPIIVTQPVSPANSVTDATQPALSGGLSSAPAPAPAGNALTRALARLRAAFPLTPAKG